MYTVVRRMLLWMARSPQWQRVILALPPARRVARRFVAGERLEDALAVIRMLNLQGMHATLDYLGENVTSEAVARSAADAYVDALMAIHREGLHSGVSVKLTHLGLDLDEAIAYENLHRIVACAAEVGRFVRIDMESSAYVGRTLALYRRIRETFDNVGVVVQSYLYRTPRDVASLIEAGIADVRLVKGAYDEPPSLAWQERRQIREAFYALLRQLWEPAARAKGSRVAVASHDDAIIHYTCTTARRVGIAPDAFEFQFLYGVRRERARALVAAGYRMRVYVPYGTHWYPYFMRRLAERPANLAFFLRAVAMTAQEG